MALAQFHRMEKTLEKTPDLNICYQKVLQEYVDMDHMEPCYSFETSAEKQFLFFLPHHAVIRPESKSTKLRIVFNGSKKTDSGFSLNDVLYAGPILQADLMQIVLRWRYYKYVFTGDIQKMYRQVLIHPEDRKFQQIIFRPSPNQSAKQFQLKTVTFGINCAPFLALRTLQQLSEDCKNQYPKASDILRSEIYVDDVLSGGHTLEEAKIKQTQLIKALNSACFPLKKLTANNSVLLEHLAREDLLDEDFLKIDDSSTIKTLGIRWNAIHDIFYYVVEPISPTSGATKRQVLSIIARLFDPLGWLGPIIITAKLLMQKLWEDKIDWDEGIPPHLLMKWKSFIESLPNIAEIKIPRYVNFSPGAPIQIHGFCDASEKAYCGVIYIRTVDENQVISSHLLVANTKVAPLKKTTIPKLELCGAELLTKMIKQFQFSFGQSYDLYLWTDSSIVLGWLQKPPQILKTFVANSVTKILDITRESQWKHIRTEDNPADLGTQGCSSQDLINNSLWWHGPSWLQQPIEVWPKPRTFDPTDLETKKVSTFHLELQEDITSRFSSLNRALRVVSYMFRFVKLCRRKVQPENKNLTSAEIVYTKNRLIILAQRIHYPREYENLQDKKQINNKSHILTLNPFLDKEGLLRVGGRLQNAGLSYSERHPVIIPEKSDFAMLFVRYTHQILLHAEYNIMLRAIRQGFYIPRLKNCIRKCIRECKACTICKQKFQNQLMAALPPERVNFSLPFTYAGVDFAGPFNIKAVHIEVCSDLSADSFLAAFSRFTGRRGLPKTTFSDNGRNFVGANFKLLKEHNNFLKNAEKCIEDKYALHGFSWSFIPPYAPHMGGLWEAAAKSMKSHLKKVTNNLSFTFEEFATLLIKIKAVLNSRPISPISENPDELLPLTPGHLLRGAALIAPPESLIEPHETEISHLSRWKRLKAIQHAFSQRWKSEYITELQSRFKWKTTRNNIKVDDFVIIKDDTCLPRSGDSVVSLKLFAEMITMYALQKLKPKMAQS
ncbi:uncharacterized protein LOC142239814 [Haematobia irritans]|uniref:uncharacterized protein LOC142239814 n=1 Tax=Haematobia irritans TaxID=7368 RepID=UPI003F50669A